MGCINFEEELKLLLSDPEEEVRIGTAKSLAYFLGDHRFAQMIWDAYENGCSKRECDLLFEYWVRLNLYRKEENYLNILRDCLHNESYSYAIRLESLYGLWKTIFPTIPFAKDIVQFDGLKDEKPPLHTLKMWSDLGLVIP